MAKKATKKTATKVVKKAEQEEEGSVTMTDHQPMPVAGYTTQSQSNVDLANEGKALEEQYLRWRLVSPTCRRGSLRRRRQDGGLRGQYDRPR